MKFFNYLNEEENVYSVIPKECKQIIKIYKNAGYKYLYRGSSNIAGFAKIVPRKDREPLDMPLEIHNILDKEFKKKFGWKVRSEGVFCTSNADLAEEYGNVNMIFPIGSFKYVWSPSIIDIYNYLHDAIARKFLFDIGREDLKNRPKAKAYIEGIVKQYTDTNLEKAITTKHEVAIKCKAYYSVNLYTINDFDITRIVY